jgi:hypothetical protein
MKVQRTHIPAVVFMLLAGCNASSETTTLDAAASTADTGTSAASDVPQGSSDGGVTGVDAPAPSVPDAAAAVDVPAIRDAAPGVSPACMAVVAELGEGAVDSAGFTSAYVARATACGIRLAAFQQRTASGRWQQGWRFAADTPGRYLVAASRVVVVADLLLVAVFDTSPAEPEAAVMIDADDAVFCQRVTYPLRWPAQGTAFAPLTGVMAARTPVADAQVAAVCRHGRVHRIDVAPLDGLTGNLTPFGELLSSAGGSRLWSQTVLVPRAEGSAGFSLAVSMRFLTAGSMPRFTFAGARTMLAGECRDVALIVDVNPQASAPTAAMWSVGRTAQDPRLCTARTTTASVSNGYLVVN